MKLGVAADHGGFALKVLVVDSLRGLDCQLFDFGAHTLADDDDYPDFVLPLAEAVARTEVDRGIAICGSGVGACIAANKVPGVRAALVHDVFSARQGVEDDDMNLLCLGGRVVGPALAWEVVQAFLDAEFSGAERHTRRLAKIAAIEQNERKDLP